MAKKGAFGVFEFGTSPVVVGELRTWTYAGTASEIDTTVMGTGNARTQPGAVAHTINCDVFWESADAGQVAVQAALGSDTPQTATLYPYGNDSGKQTLTGAFFVNEVTSTAAADGAVEASYTLSADENGITYGTVP